MVSLWIRFFSTVTHFPVSESLISSFSHAENAIKLIKQIANILYVLAS